MNNESKKIEVSESNLKAAFEVADESTKKVLEALFGKIEPTNENKPNLYDYKTIKTYEDACIALGEKVDEEKLSEAGVPKHIIALMKLELVCKSLWGGEVKVYPDSDGNRIYWYPCFDLYSQSEINRMSDEDRSCLLSANATIGAPTGWWCTHSRSSRSLAPCGFRLCLYTYEKARYFGIQFLGLWTEYLAYNVSVSERLK